ncbi:MAG: hypothetical protein Q3960_03465 [Lactobacillus sp.]|nr:hypothetical protein [Lactobacillus sp.]
MKILTKELIKKIEEKDFLEDLETARYADLKSKAKCKEAASVLLNKVKIAISKDRLVSTGMLVEGMRPVTFTLESNIINLPFANYKKISNFCDEEKEYEVKIYLEASGDYVNASHFRIDVLADCNEVMNDLDQVADKMADAMQAFFKQMSENSKKKAEK